MWITPNKDMLLLFFYRGADLNAQNNVRTTILLSATYSPHAIMTEWKYCLNECCKEKSILCCRCVGE
jgi:hypothetical protein